MRLSDVQHQDVAVDRLRRALKSRRVPHAYLFTGPAGVGKEMLATRLGQLLLCSGAEPASGVREEACNKCEDCVLFAAGNHPDFHRIHRALNKLHPDKTIQRRKAIDLGVEIIRHFVLDRIALSPSRGQAKVFVISDADRMNAASQNALLKTLEEPPGHSYLILLAAAADQLLPTTRSRCQQIPFGTLPDEFIQESLTARNLAPDHAQFITQLSQGSLGQALRQAEMKLYERTDEVLAAIKDAQNDPLAAGKSLMDLSKELSSDAKNRDDEDESDSEGERGTTKGTREAQALVIAMVSTVLRDMQRSAVGLPPLASPNRPSIAESRASAQSIGRVIRTMGLSEYQIEQNANTSLVFDEIGIALGSAFPSNQLESAQ